MAKFLLGLGQAGLLVYALLLVAIWAGQRNLLYHPDANPLQDAERLGATTLTLQAADGTRLLAWWLPPADARAPVALYLHGNGANLDARSERLRALHEDGAGVLALSWRGYGGSEGSPSEAGWAQDADAAWAWLRSIGVAPQRVLLFGESLGSAQAVLLAARLPADARPGALLLDSSFDSAQALAAGHYPFVPVRWLMRDPHRADLAAAQLKLPVLQVHCARDSVSPLAHAQKLQAAFAQRSELLVLDDDCHVPGYGLYRERVKTLVRQLRGR